MKHFKEPKTGELYAYETDGSQDAFIKPGLVRITDAEAEAIRAANVQPVPRADVVRARLAVIDADSVRALRVALIEQAGGKPVPAFERAKLQTLETEAATLRAELATLGAA